MKIITGILRIITGVLFIFSGLVKANDPLGLSYKMEEFFEVWTQSLVKGSFFLNQPLINLFDFLHHHSLGLSVLMIAFEIIAGAALLLGWRMKIFGWLLLLLIIFFTFLTGYAVFSGKFKNCGCFGDCLPISPMVSFSKDLLLLLFIGFLFWQRKNIKPLFSKPATAILILIVTIASLVFQWYTLTYLPIADCLPFKKGNNITEQMQVPVNAIPDSTVITFVYEKAGKKVEFTADKFPADFNGDTYKFVSRYDKILRKGSNNEPPIKGLVLSGITNEDSTNIVLTQPYALLLFSQDFSTPVRQWEKSFAELFAVAKAKKLPVYFVTTRPGEVKQNLASTPFANIAVFKCDFTVMRTAARTNPCLYLLKEGTVLDKWSYKRIGNATSMLKDIPVQKNIVAPVVVKDTSNKLQ